MAVSIMNLIRALVSQLRETQAFSSYFHKIAVSGHFGFPIFSKIDRVLPLWSSMDVSNMNLIRALVSRVRETQALACGGGCGRGGVQTKTIISPKF